ncbi:MAG: aminotransferase class V-fold PLP-dependent enzyme [Pseudomonadota bacterium]
MIEDRPGLMEAVRARFAHVDACPYEGPRVFFETAGGALTLNSVVETSAKLAAIPDNQGRDNAASKAMSALIDQGKADIRLFLNAASGQVFVGESGTEVLFRLLRAACLGTPSGRVLGTTLEHAASRSAAGHWAKAAGKKYVCVDHDAERGRITVDHYRPHLGPDLRAATIVHTSPVTGMVVDVAEIAAAIREASPDCIIVVDGIQHAAHGGVDVDGSDVDGYALSPYKVFSRHGYGVGWASDRLTALAHETIDGTPATEWELGTRDAAAYATFSDVVRHFDWLGGEVSDASDPRARLEAAGGAIKAHEAALCDAFLHGLENLPGVAEIPGAVVLGGADNPAREGLVSFALPGRPSESLVSGLRAEGLRAHTRKTDEHSANVLIPLGLPDCVRVSFGHYNTTAEVARLLAAVQSLAA